MEKRNVCNTALLIKAIILFCIALIHCHDTLPLGNLLKNPVFWESVSAVGTMISVIVAVVSIVTANKRQKQQATMEYFEKFKKDMFDIESGIQGYDQEKIDTLIKNYKADAQSQEIWKQIKEYLSAVERLAVGVNTGMFDAKIINRMGGAFLYEQFEKLYPIIEHKRNKDNNPCIYEEFESMVKEILKIRLIKDQTIFRK